jgi:signal peptidase II
LRPLPGILLIAMLTIPDQLSKIWVENNLPLHQQIEVLPVFSLFRTHNTGIAFSMLTFLDDWLLTLLTIAIIGAVTLLWARTEPRQFAARLGFAFVIGGALGNLIDRIVYGHVVDFILLHTTNWSFAVFNLADSFITVGAGLIIFNEFNELRRRSHASGDR